MTAPPPRFPRELNGAVLGIALSLSRASVDSSCYYLPIQDLEQALGVPIGQGKGTPLYLLPPWRPLLPTFPLHQERSSKDLERIQTCGPSGALRLGSKPLMLGMLIYSLTHGFILQILQSAHYALGALWR